MIKPLNLGLNNIFKEDVLEAIKDIDKGVLPSFSTFPKYELIFEDKRYPPKSILRHVARRLDGKKQLSSHDIQVEETNEILKSLGFEITKMKINFGR